jgi:hypothetical protein
MCRNLAREPVLRKPAPDSGKYRQNQRSGKVRRIIDSGPEFRGIPAGFSN